MSAQQIQSNMRELKAINSEIKRLRSELKVFVNKKKQIESVIKEYLYRNEQPGIKYQDLVVLASEKKQRQRKTKEERNQEIASILESYGVRNTEDALLDISDALRGKETITLGLKIKEQNNNILEM
jgi:hypothetical protein